MIENLSPSQKIAYDGIMHGLEIGNILVLWGKPGMGRTTVLNKLHSALKGAFINMKDFLDAMRTKHPLALEETFEQIVMKRLREKKHIIIDDFNILIAVIGNGSPMYFRNGFFNAPLTVISTYAVESGRKLILCCNGQSPAPIHQRCYYFGIQDLQALDYEFLCHAYLKSSVACRLDYEKIYRFAPKLNAHQLKGACLWLSQKNGLDTEQFIEYLISQHMASNVKLLEVEKVELNSLKGIDDVIQSLEANIILPLENDTLSRELNLKPKRGVLLAGPPGTGKTTIGRALAHRLKSKFFLIDGTFISGTGYFYHNIQQVFELAKQNAPSIIFIDDSDVIFENGHGLGLYRYLLTMLDGLESKSIGEVCIIMTAMDVRKLPPALVRSGRIELWLEMRLPDENARGEILSQLVEQLPSLFKFVDIDSIVSATEGFTGADLKRLVEDSKTLVAYDRAKELPLKPLTEYFLSSVQTVRANKACYEKAEANVNGFGSLPLSFFKAANHKKKNNELIN